MITCATLREPRIKDVQTVLTHAPFRHWPQDEEELLGFFRLMLELLLLEGWQGQRSQ